MMIKEYLGRLHNKNQNDFIIENNKQEYNAISGQQEIGCIQYAKCGTFYELTRFQVKETWRNKHVGKSLLEGVIHDAHDDGIDYIKVNPSSNPYFGDSAISVSLLYEIYWKLGFRFIEHKEITSIEVAKQQSWFNDMGHYMKMDVEKTK